MTAYRGTLTRIFPNQSKPNAALVFEPYLNGYLPVRLSMPELPDVEVYRRLVDRSARGRGIADLDVDDDILLDGVSRSVLRNAVAGATIGGTRRHGKQLFVRLERANVPNAWLRFHFGMTGRLVSVFDGAVPEYAYARLRFEGGGLLAFTVPRKFGRLSLVDDPDSFIAEKNLGPDALRIDRPEFESVLAERRGMIKTAFLDQSVLAGLGNIYADEILFQVGVHPRTKIADLGDETRHALFDAMKEVLHVAIQHEADPDALPADRYMLPHRRGDNRDPVTGVDMETLKVGGRTAYYSPARQPPPAS